MLDLWQAGVAAVAALVLYRLISKSNTAKVVLRTPEDRFKSLPDYPFAPHYVELEADPPFHPTVRMHYVDEGSRTGPVVLLLHGEPSWSYLYRHMIPELVRAGFRVVAPDLIGFGKSDKPDNVDYYTYARHVQWLWRFLEKTKLTEITLFCQDWGSLTGLRVAAEHPERFARIVLGNGGLPTGDEKLPRAFFIWQFFAKWSPFFPIGRVLQFGTVKTLSGDEVAAYDAPFPSAKYKAAARAFPLLVPCSPKDPATPAQRAAWAVFRAWTKPFLTAFSNRDPITRGGHKIWQAQVPGCKELTHPVIRNAGHFLQEDQPAEIAKVIADFVKQCTK